MSHLSEVSPLNIPQSVLQASINDVLETMYFMSPTYLGSALPGVESLGVAVDFTGPVRGRFCLYVTRTLACRMTADVLACDSPSPHSGQVDATVKELANVACGSSMSAWMPNVNFEYRVPCPIPSPPGPLTPVMHSFSVLSDQPEIFFAVALENQA